MYGIVPQGQHFDQIGGILSYVSVLVHAVFRTYASRATLPTDERVKVLYQEIWGIVKNKGSHLYRINSMTDHVHILFTLPQNISLADFMKVLKGSSSKHIKNRSGFEHFDGWGEGYAALSYNLKDKDMIVKYIISQQEHHKVTSFRDEFMAMAKEMGLVLDERDWDR